MLIVIWCPSLMLYLEKTNFIYKPIHLFVTNFFKNVCDLFCFPSWVLSHALALGSYCFIDLPSFFGCTKKSFLGFPGSPAELGCMTAPSAQHHTETWLLALDKIVPDFLFLLQINNWRNLCLVCKQFVSIAVYNIIYKTCTLEWNLPNY